MPVETYRVFVRNWWRWEASQFGAPRRKVPDPGARKYTLATRLGYDEAREMAQEWNRTHAPGPLSRKAEFDSE